MFGEERVHMINLGQLAMSESKNLSKTKDSGQKIQEPIQLKIKEKTEHPKA